MAITARYEAHVRDFADGYVAEDPLLVAAREYAGELGLAPVSPAAGAALRLVAAAGAARAVVEIGTGTGVSGLWLLRGMRPDGVLTTIDVEAEHQRVARRVFAAAGLPPVAHPDHHRTGARRAPPAGRRRLRPGVRRTTTGWSTRRAVAAAARLLRPGGLLVLGDAWSGGRLTDPAARDPHTVALREVLKALRDEDGWLPAFLPTADGLPAPSAANACFCRTPRRAWSHEPRTRTHRAPPSRLPPFSLAASLAAMSGFRPSAGDQLILVDRVRKGLAHPDQPREAVVVEVARRPDAAPGVRLDVYAGAARCPPPAPASSSGGSRAWLGLDDDMRPLLPWRPTTRRWPSFCRWCAGLHQVRFGSLAEGTTYFALTQRSTQWFATARKARIAAELGPRVAFEGETYVAFPGLAELAALGADGLFTFAGNAQRALRLAEVLERSRRARRAGPAHRAVRGGPPALLGVRGIGTFTANAILLRVLGRPDDVPLEMTQFTAVDGRGLRRPRPRAGRAARAVRAVRRLVGYLCRDRRAAAPRRSAARPRGRAWMPAAA